MIELHFNDTVLQVQEDDSSFCYNSIGLEQSMTLKFSVAEPLDIPVGAWCVFNGVEYTLLKPNNIKKSGTRNLTYSLLLNGPFAKSGNYKLRNTVDRRLKFSMCARPREFLQLIVDNLNMRDGGWSVGKYIDSAEKTIEFNHVFINDALQSIIKDFDTECEVVGKVINLGKVEYFKDDPLPLSYGKGNGFKPGVGRMNPDDEHPVEILFVQGGRRNIDASKYGSADLLLPAGQELEYEGRVYIADQDGYSICRKDKAIRFGFEDSFDGGEIYPSRVGTVSSVVVVDEAKNFYDIVDDSIPDSLNYRDCRIAGETMTIKFQSGMLAGKEFEIQQTEDALTGYDPSEKRFELVPTEIDGITMPGGVFVPRTGDTFAVFGCMLPDAYIRDDETKTGASWDMFREAARYMYEHEDFRFTFTGDLQALWTRRNWLRVGGRLRIGSYIRFSDIAFVPDGVDIRITGVKTYLNAPYSPTIEISNSVSGSRVNSALKKAENAEVIIEDKYRDAIQFTKRRFRDSKETIAMLEDALLENFSSSINPLTVQTMAMLVGDESLQYQFVSSMENPTVVPHNVTYDLDARVLYVPAGIIQHMTLGISTLSSSHKISEYSFWSLGEYVSPVLYVAEKKYYLYARVSTTNKLGEFLLSETAIGMKEVSGYYHLLVGVLNSEYDGERSFVTLYGFTEVLPGRITTDRIVSGDGNSFLDLLNNALKLHDKLQFNVNGDGELKLKGTIVQSQSGAEEYIGCYRGVYNDTYTYYRGDEVTFAIGSLYSLYRQKNDSPCRNIPPTNTTYWEIQASAGHNGNYTSNVFKQSKAKPATPTGTEKIPSGWSDAPTATGCWWMSKATISGATNEAITAWSEPVKVTAEDGVDGGYTDFKYRKNTSSTSAPAITKSSRNPQYWSDDPPTLSEGEYLWMSQAEINADNTLNGEWSSPTRISGEKGSPGLPGTPGLNGNNGDWYKFLYRHSMTKPEKPSGNTPAGWSDTPDMETLSFVHQGTFSYKDGYYVSPQIEDSELIKNRVSFTTTKPNQVVAIEIVVDSEQNYDFGLVGLLDDTSMTRTSNYTDRASGGNVSKTVYINVPTGGDHFIEIGYAKDSSDGFGQDNMKYRTVKVENCWVSTARIDGVTQNAGTWSDPVPFYMDNNDTERIYILSKTETIPAIPTSDPYVDDFVPPLTTDDYNPENRYAVGKLARYNGGFYKAKKASSSDNVHTPAEAEYWEAVSGWTDNPSEVTFDYPIQYEAIRKKTNGMWGEFLTPTVWMRYAYNGDYFEVRYAVNGSTTAHPYLTTAMRGQRNPEGWTVTQPNVGALEYLWRITAKISGETNELLLNWSNPIRITPYDGSDGADGSSPALVYCHVYDPDTRYYGTKYRVDAVEKGGKYYVARTDAGEFSNVAPPDESKWNDFGAQFESVATKLLLAENANLANLLFRNQRLESAAQTNGIPNFFLDGLKNIASFAAGSVVFDGAGANIGWLKVVDRDLLGFDNDGLIRLRMTPNALPSAVGASTREDVSISEKGGEASYIPDNNYDVRFEQRVHLYYGNPSDVAMSLNAYVEFNVDEDGTQIELGGVRLNCKVNHLNSTEDVYLRCSMSAYVKRKVGSEWVDIGILNLTDSSTTKITIPNASRIRIYFSGSATPGGFECTGTFMMAVQTLQAITAKSEMIIAKDGVMAIYNANYMRMHSTEGFTVMIGNRGFRVTANGIQKTTDGTTWYSV